MGFRFRKTIGLVPGLRINLSKSGASLSIGGGGAVVNLGPRGTRATVGLPGTGMSYSTMLTLPKTRGRGGLSSREQLAAILAPLPADEVRRQKSAFEATIASLRNTNPGEIDEGDCREALAMYDAASAKREGTGDEEPPKAAGCIGAFLLAALVVAAVCYLSF